MRLFSNTILAALLLQAALAIAAPQSVPAASGSLSATSQAPSLNEDRDPVRSPDDNGSAAAGELTKNGESYTLRADVDEVVLNATVLEGDQLVQDLKKDDFTVFEDGVKQTLISFQHTDLPVSMGLIDRQLRLHVPQAALGQQERARPDPGLESPGRGLRGQLLRRGLHRPGLHLRHRASCATACRTSTPAAARPSTTPWWPRQTSSPPTPSAPSRSSSSSPTAKTTPPRSTSEQTIRRVQQLSGPVIYSIGLLFGDEMSRAEVRHARRALEMLSTETGGMAFFPKSIEQIDQIAAEVARDIRSQYTLGYRSTKPSTEPGFRSVEVVAEAKGTGKLTVRTRTGYYPAVHETRQSSKSGN